MNIQEFIIQNNFSDSNTFVLEKLYSKLTMSFDEWTVFLKKQGFYIGFKVPINQTENKKVKK